MSTRALARPAAVIAALFAATCGAAPTAGEPTAARADKLFAVTFSTGPNWDPAKPPQEQPHFHVHSANLARLRAENAAVLGGRFAEYGFVILRARDEAAVQAELARDPSLAAGTFVAKVAEYRPFYHGDTRPPLRSPELDVVRAAIAAFNAHDAAAFAGLLAEDVKWMSLDADKLGVEGDGREALRQWLTGYFGKTTGVRSEIHDLAQSGAHVSFRERVSWQASDGTRRAQSALAVYEVRSGLIVRVWYFPATREPTTPGK